MGCPKNQNRCCQRIGLPPPDGSKKWKPHLRSSSVKMIATVSDGKEKMIIKAVTISLQMKSERRLIERPGQRSLKTVTVKLIADTVDETVRNSSPSDQKS